MGSMHTHLMFVCICLAQALEIDRDRSENFIHQLSNVFCCETKGAAFASGSSCLILGTWNIVSISSH